jgi:glutathione S-transferase
MKLYTFPPSPNSLRVVALADQLGIPLEQVFVDLTKGEQLKPDFIRMNPNHMIPTLKDGDFVVWDSTAIMYYLAESKPGSGVIPDNVQQRAKLHQWVAWNNAHLSPACAVYTYERLVKSILKLGEPDANELARADERFHRFAQVLDDQLKNGDFLVGRTLSLADHHVVAQFAHAQAGGYPMQKYRNIQNWVKRMFDMPSWKKALAALAH